MLLRRDITTRNWRVNTAPGTGENGVFTENPPATKTDARHYGVAGQGPGHPGSCRGQRWTVQVKLADPAAPVAPAAVAGAATVTVLPLLPRRW